MIQFKLEDNQAVCNELTAATNEWIASLEAVSAHGSTADVEQFVKVAIQRNALSREYLKQHQEKFGHVISNLAVLLATDAIHSQQVA